MKYLIYYYYLHYEIHVDIQCCRHYDVIGDGFSTVNRKMYKEDQCICKPPRCLPTEKKFHFFF